MFCWKNVSNFCSAKATHICQQKISEYCILNPLKQLTKWSLTSSLSQQRFEQLGPDFLPKILLTSDFCDAEFND